MLPEEGHTVFARVGALRGKRGVYRRNHYPHQRERQTDKQRQRHEVE